MKVQEQRSYRNSRQLPEHTKPLSNSSTVIPIERQCTNYTISVRCAVTTYDSSTIGLWSGWSPEVTVISPLDVRNEHLRIWRLRSRVKENRTVQLLWKGPPASCHAVDHYLVTLEPKSYQGKTKLPETSSSASITLHSKEAYNVSIAAYRKKTKVLESTLTIPAIGKEDSGLSPVAEAHAFSLNHQIYVHWSAPHWSPQGYIVHWCCIGHDCEWQETQATNITLKGHPKKLYAITVVPFSKSLWPGQETTVLGYSEEGAPGKVSNVDVSEETRTGALVKWSPVSRDSCCGFVVNYTVFYRNGEGRERWVTVNDTVQEVRLEHLQPGSQYQVHVMSSSVAGTTNSSEYNFRTSSYDPSFIRMLSIFGSLGIIFLLIIGISCFAVVKKYVLKPVPNPADSDLMSSLPENMNRPLLIPDSMSENLNISVCTVGPSVDGSVPSIPSLEDNQETPDCLPGLTSAPVEPSSSLPVTQGWPVHGEEQKGMDPAMSGSSYLCNKLDNSQSKLATEPVLVPAQAPAQAQAPAPAPAPAKENRALQEIQAWRPDSQPMQAYVSLDMLDRAV
ncbi:hypothetical protein JZ751_011716 [Albula glossodonta]|uniref:Fibronectin type-III domain-containing protein n=1 Tax=Albula glossodonta TaxID=121402 RepID=A0A8T2PQH2_9TELE|nr:hypothetical protein JZ751_011716 [Albula glossodonta]